MTGPDDTPLARLEKLLRRLPRVAFELGRRERAPLTIRDERDLDDLVRALLPIEFEDVRAESRTPSYSSRTRISFLLPSIEAVVASHLIGPRLDETEMKRRRIEDVEFSRSRSHTLVLFVHDPERRLPDPERLEAVWSRPAGVLIVQCVIA